MPRRKKAETPSTQRSLPLLEQSGNLPQPKQSLSTRTSKNPCQRAPGPSGSLLPTNLDVRIYGLCRPMSGENLLFLQLGPEELERWKRLYLPLKPSYSSFDFTPAGQIALLKQRGYSVGAIRKEFPALAPFLETACQEITPPG